MDHAIVKAVKALRAAQQTLRDRMTYAALQEVMEAEKRLNQLLEEEMA